MTYTDYFPLASGRYEVKPGLFRFGKALGGGEADQHVFQFSDAFARYRAAKLANRAERIGKYFCTDRLSRSVAGRLAGFIVKRLAWEHPERFTWANGTLTCSLTEERLILNERFELVRVDGPDGTQPNYLSAIDALAMQVQEDLAIVQVENGRDWLSAIHLSFPNFWAAEDKIGKEFPAVHEPVAGMEQMNRRSEHLIQLMLGAVDGLVRFAWGVTWDDELNHHPDRTDDGIGQSPMFDPIQPRAFLRLERQTVWGFPELNAVLFTIRTYFHDCNIIRQNPKRRACLIAALESMSEESLHYKRLAASHAALIKWLKS